MSLNYFKSWQVTKNKVVINLTSITKVFGWFIFIGFLLSLSIPPTAFITGIIALWLIKRKPQLTFDLDTKSWSTSNKHIFYTYSKSTPMSENDNIKVVEHTQKDNHSHRSYIIYFHPAEDAGMLDLGYIIGIENIRESDNVAYNIEKIVQLYKHAGIKLTVVLPEEFKE